MSYLLKIIYQENFYFFHFGCSDNRYKENHAPKNRIKKTLVHSRIISVYLNVEAFLVHELPPLVFKRFAILLHYSVMVQMILAFINTFQILNINLLMNLKI